MTIEKIIELLQSGLKRKIETKITKIEEFEQIENELKTNIDIFAKEKHIYVSKKQYALSVVFVIKSGKEGGLKNQHERLRKSAEYSKDRDPEIKPVVEELKLPNTLKTAVSVAKYLLYDNFKYYKMDPISWEEKAILDTIGMKAKFYAKPCMVEDIYDYDVNSMYSYLLCKKHFKFPISEGKYEEITEIDKKKLGIYKLNILSDVDERIFMKNKAYDTYDIELLDHLGYKYELADKKAYIYEKTVRGDKFFSYLKDLYDLRKKYTVAKQIMNSTWGLCAEHNITTLEIYVRDRDGDFIEGENPEIKRLQKEGYEIQSYNPYDNECELQNFNLQPFKFDLARLSYFICSYVRLYLGQILSQKEILQSLCYVHTDGFRCKVKPDDIDFIIGKKIGELKYKQLDGKFYFKNLNEMYYFNEDINKWELYDKNKEYIKKLIN